ncbi:hypothetical protein [Actinophytocola sp. NPDC049390]|uniref:hypothetical protein n=1 Tax=Actinophytocola sp. NPDC049390 TaxID=3363894 RepID=UPI0037B8FA2F
MPSRRVILVLTLGAVVPLAGCTSAAGFEERMDFLRQMSRQGAQTHDLLAAQEAPDIDEERCDRAFDGIVRTEDFPSDLPSGGQSKEWAAQIREFFVDSCVSGKPKPTDNREPPTPTPTTTTAVTTTTTPEP